MPPLGNLSWTQCNEHGFGEIERGVEAKRKGCWCMQQFSSKILVGYLLFAEKKLLFGGLKIGQGRSWAGGKALAHSWWSVPHLHVGKEGMALGLSQPVPCTEWVPQRIYFYFSVINYPSCCLTGSSLGRAFEILGKGNHMAHSCTTSSHPCELCSVF